MNINLNTIRKNLAKDAMLKTLELELMPDAGGKSYIKWKVKAEEIFDTKNPSYMQIKTVAIYGEDAKLLKGVNLNDENF